MANALIHESSPYLLQHADNPVDWVSWSDEAFARAKRENKLIFLSIGYSTCHWCHVMAHESFENKQAAALMNDLFVNVKVDREERPDIDATFMGYLQMTTGHGGWPMSLWLTPDGEPIVGGTYFPLADQEGRIGFKSVCQQIADLWKEDPDRAMASAHRVFTQMQQQADQKESVSLLDDKVLAASYEDFHSQFDPEHGGFGNAPKFPRPVGIDLLLAIASRDRESNEGKRSLQMADFTLQMMASGGMYDQLAGGFHRYSVDRYWHVPHYEKMLYDQGLLLFTYAEAYRVSRNGFYAGVIDELFTYLVGTLKDEVGLYHSGEDADSVDVDGVKKEGAYWTWTVDQVYQVLQNPKHAAIFCAYFGLEQDGNARPESDPHGDLVGRNTLYVAGIAEELAEQFDLEVNDLKAVLLKSKKLLLKERARREMPHRDDKLVAAWNAYVLKGLSYAAWVTGEEKLKTAAVQLAGSMKEYLWDGEELYRSVRKGVRNVRGFAQDYAALIEALLVLRSIAPSAELDEWVLELQDVMDTKFWDASRGAYTLSLAVAGKSVFTMVEDYDGAEPSLCALALGNLSRLVTLFPDKDFGEKLASLMQVAGLSAKANGFASPAIVREWVAEKRGRMHYKVGEDSTLAALKKLRDLASADAIIERVPGSGITECSGGQCQIFE